jgi:hypothetical protein
MDILILIIVVAAAGAAIVLGVAFSQGWFRLAPVPTSQKYQFVLMRKAGIVYEDSKSAPVNAPPPAVKTAEPPVQNEDNH